MKLLLANRIAPDGTPRSAAHIWGYSVCLCPTKGTPLERVKRLLHVHCWIAGIDSVAPYLPVACFYFQLYYMLKPLLQ